MFQKLFSPFHVSKFLTSHNDHLLPLLSFLHSKTIVIEYYVLIGKDDACKLELNMISGGYCRCPVHILPLLLLHHAPARCPHAGTCLFCPRLSCNLSLPCTSWQAHSARGLSLLFQREQLATNSWWGFVYNPIPLAFMVDVCRVRSMGVGGNTEICEVYVLHWLPRFLSRR